MSEPFLSPDIVPNKVCFLCSKTCKEKERVNYPTVKGWVEFVDKSRRWSERNIPIDDPLFHYGAIFDRVKEFDHDDVLDFVQNGNCKSHSKCRVNFINRITRYEIKYPRKNITLNQDASENTDNISDQTINCRTPRTFQVKKICFVCNEVRDSDTNVWKEGGLARCERESAQSTLSRCQNYYKDKPSHDFYNSSKRLEILLSGTSYDIFSLDVYYHHSCYREFTRMKTPQQSLDNAAIQSKNDVLESFMLMLRIKIIRDKYAFLLNELLSDIKLISLEHGLSEPIITNTCTLKRKIIDAFPDEIDFFPQGKYLIVHASDINPCKYAISTLRGSGLRDRDIIRSFASLVKRLVKERDLPEPPKTAEDFEKALEIGPLPALYNAIHMTVSNAGKENIYGYIETPGSLLASKIWSTALDWESLITRRSSPKQIVLGSSLLRMTGSKTAIRLLNKCNHVASYNEIKQNNIEWANLSGSRLSLFSNLRKGVPTHSTIDNNDGRQETLTGTGTTHDTNQTLFQTPSTRQLTELKTIGVLNEKTIDFGKTINDIDMFDDDEIGFYKVNDKLEPQPIKEIRDDENCRSELEGCLKKDVLWSLAGSLPDNCTEGETLQKLGSWTAFNRVTNKLKPLPCIQEFLPVVPHPPKYPICKKYLDFMLDVMKDLEIPFIFVHSDEDIYSKLCTLLWNNKELYSNIILLMGGFHQLRVRQKLIFKRFLCLDLKVWTIDAKVIASGSADQAWEGRHYYRSMRVHKECFDALIRFRIEQITDYHRNIDSSLLNSLIDLRKNPSHQLVEKITNEKTFDTIFQSILTFEEGSEGHLTVEYIKDVSSMLAMVSAVREGNFERHLQSERDMLKQTFAFDHYNYARYCSYQHVILRSLEKDDHPAVLELKENGFGASITGDDFSAIHGDLVTELFNKETKSVSGPFRRGFSTSTKSVNVWIRTIHIQARLLKSLKSHIGLKTSSMHKELTEGAKILHDKHVKSLQAVLRSYGIDPFGGNKPKSFSTGEEIDDMIISDVLSAPKIGNDKYKLFVSERLVGKSKSFFSKIPKNKLKFAKQKIKKKPKEKTVMQEDRNAFGFIIAKSIDPITAFKYPITTYPLAIAEPDGTLRSSSKSLLRNFLIDECLAEIRETPKSSEWLIDGMAAIRSISPRKTYKDWLKAFISFIHPPIVVEPIGFSLINDVYFKESTKGCTRSKRGEADVTVNVNGLDQHMPQGKNWNSFLSNGENKTSLIDLIGSSIELVEIKSLVKVPFIFTKKENTYELKNNIVRKVGQSNHEEADTRLIMHALSSQNDIVVVCEDSDVLILMIWAYSKFNVKRKWFMKYDDEKYACIKTIVEYLGDEISECLPQIHAITGCDQTSAFFRRGKVKIVKNLISNTKPLSLIKNIGVEKQISEEMIDDFFEFVRTVVYNGKPNENYLATRFRLYKESSSKSTTVIPPDPDSLSQALRRIHHIVYVWVRSYLECIDILPFQDYGWKWCEEKKILIPVWFTGSQLPPTNKKGRKTKDDQTPSDDADDEIEDEERDKKRVKTKISQKSAKKRKVDDKDKELTEYEESENELSSDSQQSDNSEWEVSDFDSSSESDEEWEP